MSGMRRRWWASCGCPQRTRTSAWRKRRCSASLRSCCRQRCCCSCRRGRGGGHVLGGAGGHAAADARDLVADLLSAIQEVIAGDPTPYQNLFRHGLAFWLFLLLLKGCAKWVPAHLARTSPSADTASRSYVERCV